MYSALSGRSSSTVIPAGNAIDGMTSGTWMEVAGSNLSSVYPSPLPTGTPSTIMTSWGGGAYDSIRDRLVVLGGGHADYSGNEVYAFDIDNLSWLRLTDPSTNITNTATGLYPDGNPRSFHSGPFQEYVAGIDRHISFGVGASWQNGDSYRDMVSFNFDTLAWSNPNSVPVGISAAGFSAYDSSTGNVYYQPGLEWYSLRKYNPTTNVWSDTGGTQIYSNYYNKAAIDPVRQLMVSIGSGNGFGVWDLSTGTRTTPTPTNAPALASQAAPGFIFNPDRDRFVGWDGGTGLYELNPTNWVWTQVTIDGSNTVTPSAPPVNGTNGRFQYIASKQAYIVVNATTENVYIFKV